MRASLGHSALSALWPEGGASGYWTRLAQPVSGFISHCTSTLPPSVFPLINVRLTIALRRFTISMLGGPCGIYCFIATGPGVMTWAFARQFDSSC
jgi:hypothetical protein